MHERDIHRAEGAILGGLTALTANGAGPAVLLVVLIHVVGFGAYGIYAAFSHSMGPPVFGALVGLAVVFVIRKVIGLAELPRRAMRLITVAMLLCVLVPFEAATGLFGRATAAVTGMNPDIGLFRVTGIALGPEAGEAEHEAYLRSDCLEAKSSGLLYAGKNGSVGRTKFCMAYLTPEDGERACKAFAATRKPFDWPDHREFCSTWVKGAALQPWKQRPLSEMGKD